MTYNPSRDADDKYIYLTQSQYSVSYTQMANAMLNVVEQTQGNTQLTQLSNQFMIQSTLQSQLGSATQMLNQQTIPTAINEHFEYDSQKVGSQKILRKALRRFDGNKPSLHWSGPGDYSGNPEDSQFLSHFQAPSTCDPTQSTCNLTQIQNPLMQNYNCLPLENSQFVLQSVMGPSQLFPTQPPQSFKIVSGVQDLKPKYCGRKYQKIEANPTNTETHLIESSVIPNSGSSDQGGSGEASEWNSSVVSPIPGVGSEGMAESDRKFKELMTYHSGDWGQACPPRSNPSTLLYTSTEYQVELRTAKPWDTQNSSRSCCNTAWNADYQKGHHTSVGNTLQDNANRLASCVPMLDSGSDSTYFQITPTAFYLLIERHPHLQKHWENLLRNENENYEISLHQFFEVVVQMWVASLQSKRGPYVPPDKEGALQTANANFLDNVATILAPILRGFCIVVTPKSAPSKSICIYCST